jgi:site-specific recombinase XerD
LPPAQGIDDWAEVRPSHLRRFLADEATRRPALQSHARTVAALKGFLRFLLENDEIERTRRRCCARRRSMRRCRTCSDRRKLDSHAASPA